MKRTWRHSWMVQKGNSTEITYREVCRPTSVISVQEMLALRTRGEMSNKKTWQLITPSNMSLTPRSDPTCLTKGSFAYSSPTVLSCDKFYDSTFSYPYQQGEKVVSTWPLTSDGIVSQGASRLALPPIHLAALAAGFVWRMRGLVEITPARPVTVSLAGGLLALVQNASTNAPP